MPEPQWKEDLQRLDAAFRSREGLAEYIGLEVKTLNNLLMPSTDSSPNEVKRAKIKQAYKSLTTEHKLAQSVIIRTLQTIEKVKHNRENKTKEDILRELENLREWIEKKTAHLPQQPNNK